MINSFSGTYRFLSNFYESEIVVWGWEFKTVEHAFQAWKMASEDDAKRVQDSPTPGKAKRLARKLTMREDWDSIKNECMLILLRAKFSIPELKEKLLATGNVYLEEGNTWGDRYWGTVHGQGENNLGKLLMIVREELRDA